MYLPINLQIQVIQNFLHFLLICSLLMAPKGKIPKNKGKKLDENSMLPPPIDLDHLPLVDLHNKIAYTICEFDLLEYHNWLK